MLTLNMLVQFSRFYAELGAEYSRIKIQNSTKMTERILSEIKVQLLIGIAFLKMGTHFSYRLEMIFLTSIFLRIADIESPREDAQ